MKKYNQAPLPFQGQKRRFIKKVKEVLQDCPSDAVYVDLFGGSGLLAHNVKYLYPEAHVIYNDFDDYSRRLKEIDNTNKLIEDIRKITEPLERNKKIPETCREAILKRVKKEEETNGYVDYITLSASLLFSMNYANNYDELSKETFYNSVRKSNYDGDGYLKGVEIVSVDYRVLFEEYKDFDDVVFLVDPPYLSTETKTYKGVDRWGIKDYLDVLNVLNGTKYIYFTSNKSEIVELCEWFETRSFTGNPFKYATTATVNQLVNYSSSYTDIMLYKVDFK